VVEIGDRREKQHEDRCRKGNTQKGKRENITPREKEKKKWGGYRARCCSEAEGGRKRKSCSGREDLEVKLLEWIIMIKGRKNN